MFLINYFTICTSQVAGIIGLNYQSLSDSILLEVSEASWRDLHDREGSNQEPARPKVMS